jgi:TldD protein
LKKIMSRALDLAQSAGAQYADIRVVENRTESIQVKNGVVESLNFSESMGFGIRVLVNGAWGFSSSRELTAEEIDRVGEQALEIARASALVRGEKVDLGPPVSSQGKYVTPMTVDPFTISVEDRLGVLLAADAEMARVDGVRVRQGNLVLIREKKWFANTESAFTEQTIIETGGGIIATAVGDSEVQTRSYPNSFGRQQVTGGWEMMLQWDLPGNAERIAPCPTDTTTTVILAGDQLALQVHESCGHPIELDRVFGSEAAYAGTSFLTQEKLGNFRYGSELVNITADSVSPYGLGTFGWDDEGVEAQSVPIVKEGNFVGYLMSRETASRLEKVSNGCMRASSWNRIPLIRMTNVSLEPGEWELQDLIADTDKGIYMATNRSWSIDDKRYNFQFDTGITPEFWSGCDAVCNKNHWNMWGTPNCGKGQPSQIAHTGHGAAPARFRNVRVGVYRQE